MSKKQTDIFGQLLRMSNEKESEIYGGNLYDVIVYQLTYCKMDIETGDYLRDKNGKVIEFYVPDEDCSSIAQSVDIDELVERDW